MARTKIKSGMVDDFSDDESVDDESVDDETVHHDLIDTSVNARRLAIRRRIEDSIEAKRIREEFGFDLDKL